jgi:16S rRNA (adenine1518-N6/adenine1519-N6)-dimethyltransferase
MSLLSVSVQYYGHPQIVSILKAGAFWPRPDVDSAVIRIDLAKQPLEAIDLVKEENFFRLVRVGFSQKRKQLQKNLRQLQLNQVQIDHLLQKSGIDGRRRAETLSLDEWHALAQAIEQA